MLYFFILFLLLVYFFQWKDFMSRPSAPWNITMFVWTVIIILYCLQNTLYPLNDNFYICCLLWIIGFYATSRLVGGSESFVYEDSRRNEIFVNKWILRLYYVLIFVMLPLYSDRYLSQIGGFSFENLLDIRQNAVSGEVNLGYLSFVPSLCKALLLIELYRFNKASWLSLLYAIVVNVIAAIVIMEKGYLAFIFVAFIFFFYQKKYLKKKHLTFLGIGFIFLMFIFNIVRSLNYGELNFEDFVTLYFVSPSVAFTTIQPESSPFWGAHTFRFFYSLFYVVGLGPGGVSNWYEPVFVPIRTNVFTVMEPYYNDFGTIGILIFSIINGFIFGKVYKYSRNRNSLVLSSIYVYFIYILLFQFFQEYFFISLSVTIQLLFFLFLPTTFIKKKYV